MRGGINCDKRTGNIEEKCKGFLTGILDCATHKKATRLGLQGLVYARNSARNAAYRKLVIIALVIFSPSGCTDLRARTRVLVGVV